MARTASSSRCWGSALRRESSAGAQVKRRCSWASVSWLPQLELQLGSHFTPQRRCGQGCLTTCCPNTAEGAVELVQLCLVGVQHLGSWLGFEPHLTFSCPNLNKGKLEEKRVRLTTFTISEVSAKIYIILIKRGKGIPFTGRLKKTQMCVWKYHKRSPWLIPQWLLDWVYSFHGCHIS